MKKKKSAMPKIKEEETSEAENSTIALKTTTKRKKKKCAVSYTNAMLKNALDAVNAGMPISTASKLHNIPRTTLLYKKRSNSDPVIKNRGPECLLGEECERNLVQWFIDASQMGFTLSRVQLLDSVQLQLNLTKKTTAFTDNRPGRHWYDAFRVRHNELADLLAQNLTYSRNSITEENLKAWSNNVRMYLESKSLVEIDLSRVFSCVDAALFLTPKGNSVLVKKGEKTIHNFVNKDEKECLTTNFCGNAEGRIAPPMVIFSYKRVPGHVAESMPEKWSIGLSESGCMTGKTLYEYVANVFYPWLVKNEIVLPVVLFLDATSKLTMPLSDFCKGKGIELVALFPNATHVLQPIEVAFFEPLKTAWTNSVREIVDTGGRVDRGNFAKILEITLENMDVEGILKSGFEKTGLYPFAAEQIDCKEYCEVSAIDRTAYDDYLAFVENNIEREVLRLFKEVGEDGEWSGETEHKSLFYFWRRIKGGMNFGEVGYRIAGNIDETTDTKL